MKEPTAVKDYIAKKTKLIKVKVADLDDEAIDDPVENRC